VTLLDPRRASSYVNLGALYNRMGEFQKAVEMCRRAVQIDRKSADGYYNLGIAHRKLNQLALAVPAYREAVRINPQLIVAHQNLGNVFLDMGNAREAIAHFKLALAIDPEFAKAKVGLEKAQQLREQGKTAFSPFGRLVNTEEVAARQQQTLESSNFRSLTDEEREEDHHILQVLNRTIARAARDLRDQLKNKLVPEIIELDRSVGTEQNFQATQLKFQPIAKVFQTASRNLQAAVQELRAHEQRMLAKQQK
jgi:tetratricopeptide (TPR) repeat protein